MTSESVCNNMTKTACKKGPETMGAAGTYSGNSFEVPRHFRATSRGGLRHWIKGGWLALFFVCTGLLVEAETISHPLAPEPVAVSRSALPEGFLKESPGTVEDLKSIEGHIQGLLERLSPAVVAVQIGGTTGSGVVISEEGLVLTAAHVSGRPDRDVRFTFADGTRARGKTLGTNHEMDAGLMRITEPGPWPKVDTGMINDVQLGDWVLALGHPGGYDPERSMVIRLGRIIRMNSSSLRTDCTLVGGDSGGPLFDMHGRVIGIHSHISSSTAANFHVPIKTYHDDWERLVAGENWGSEPRSGPFAYLGVMLAEDAEGCLLDEIVPDSPAHEAGLKANDIVLRFNGNAIQDSVALLRHLRQRRPGDEVRLVVKREEEEMSFVVKLGTHPAR
jgi:serine protease Do